MKTWRVEAGFSGRRREWGRGRVLSGRGTRQSGEVEPIRSEHETRSRETAGAWNCCEAPCVPSEEDKRENQRAGIRAFGANVPINLRLSLIHCARSHRSICSLFVCVLGPTAAVIYARAPSGPVLPSRRPPLGRLTRTRDRSSWIAGRRSGQGACFIGGEPDMHLTRESLPPEWNSPARYLVLHQLSYCGGAPLVLLYGLPR